MSDLNSVVLVGRLTRDPELRYLPQGAPVAEFSLATNRRYSKKSGEQVEEVIFIDVVVWNRLAEVAAQFLRKGRQVVVSGQLIQDRWDDKDTGQKRSKIRVQAQTLQFLGGGSKDGETSEAEVPAEEPVEAPEAPPAPPTPPRAAAEAPSTGGAKGRAPARR